MSKENISLIIKCDCGNTCELKPDNNQLMLKNQLYSTEFDVGNLTIDLDKTDDVSEDDVVLGDIYLTCKVCDNYINIEDYR